MKTIELEDDEFADLVDYVESYISEGDIECGFKPDKQQRNLLMKLWSAEGKEVPSFFKRRYGW